MSNLCTPPRRHARSSSDPSSSSASSNQMRGRWQAAYTNYSSPLSSLTSVFDDSPSIIVQQNQTSRRLRPILRPHFQPAVRWLIILCCIGLTLYVWRHSIPHNNFSDAGFSLDLSSHIPHKSASFRPNPSKTSTLSRPQQWLRENSNDRHAFEWESENTLWNRLMTGRQNSPRPRAAIISLVRNEELEGMMQSMRQLEFHWNHKYRYPWIFFNEKPFNEEFKAVTRNLTSAETFYELIPTEHWSTPSWIDRDRYMDSLDYLGVIGVGKGYMLSYRNMCRWNSGFFYKHPRLKDYDFYWRVEPDVHFFCPIRYDPFRLLRDTGTLYGFTMSILEDARSFPSLWSQTQSFMIAHPELIHPSSDLSWLLDPTTGEYNNCQFFSNFEIGDLRFFRGKANEAYFEWLDQHGGFYYERFGDAPIHTLSLAMFAPKDKVWFFKDIGYQHDIARLCPPQQEEERGEKDVVADAVSFFSSSQQSYGDGWINAGSEDSTTDGGGRRRRRGRGEDGYYDLDVGNNCACSPTSLDENFYKLVPMESPQHKPAHTCIRLFLGREDGWLETKEGWSQETERAFGGDGYGGYVKGVVEG